MDIAKSCIRLFNRHADGYQVGFQYQLLRFQNIILITLAGNQMIRRYHKDNLGHIASEQGHDDGSRGFSAFLFQDGRVLDSLKSLHLVFHNRSVFLIGDNDEFIAERHISCDGLLENGMIFLNLYKLFRIVLSG